MLYIVSDGCCVYNSRFALDGTSLLLILKIVSNMDYTIALRDNYVMPNIEGVFV